VNIIIGIATSGRPDTLKAMLDNLSSQIRPPDRIIVSANNSEDVQGLGQSPLSIEILVGAAGASTQRNAIIRAAGDADVIVFFDDDFFPQNDYLLAVERHMENFPATVVLSGQVIVDGINGPGLSLADCLEILKRDWQNTRDRASNGVTDVFSGYGCNMAVRMSAIREGQVLFDENLPLYSWQEDVDLSRRLARFGNVVKCGAARGVHLGVKSGRGSGVRLGYSQVANPLYLASKREGYPVSWAVKHIGKNVAKNLLKWPVPEPYIDRRGRLRGNMIAIREVLLRRASPKRVLDL
jgi:GT2 family glycosyltransferase